MLQISFVTSIRCWFKAKSPQELQQNSCIQGNFDNESTIVIKDVLFHDHNCLWNMCDLSKFLRSM
jgi:hypothetical protein